MPSWRRGPESTVSAFTGGRVCGQRAASEHAERLHAGKTEIAGLVMMQDDQRVGLPRLTGPNLRQMWDGFFDWHDDEGQFIGDRVDWRTGATIRRIVWRFGSHRAQAVAAMHYMRSYFPDIWVFYDADPCDVQVQRP
ncbi:hypothetical protein SLS64_009593 [Diaporthe eres]|uniref:Uncharacterized protein n=1 Tax=Diaporthe eres TaxID=83184 RepID=A0ABR1NUC3_DIAER